MMTINQQEVTRKFDNTVCTIYIDSVTTKQSKNIKGDIAFLYSPKHNEVFSKYKEHTINAKRYHSIGICVSNSKNNNDNWWNGKSAALYNQSTGNGNTKYLQWVYDTIVTIAIKEIKQHGYYNLFICPTDWKRAETYCGMLRRACKKHQMWCEWLENDDGMFIHISKELSGNRQIE